MISCSYLSQGEPQVMEVRQKKLKFDVQRALQEGRGLTPISYASAFSWRHSIISYKDAVAKFQPRQLAALQAGLADTIVDQCSGGLCPQGLWCVHRMICQCSVPERSIKQESITDQFGSELCLECLNVIM